MGELKNKVRFSTTLTLAHRESLQELSDVTKIPQSELIGEAIDLLFANPIYQQWLLSSHEKEYRLEIDQAHKAAEKKRNQNTQQERIR